MTRFQSQVMYGLLIFITGAIIAILSYTPSRTIQYVLSAGMLLSAVFAFITAAKNKGSVIRLKYHELQGAGMVAYAVAIFFYATTFEKFITVTYNGNQTKQISIKGNVWKAPLGSAPSNSSIQFLKQKFQ